jgi:hypothetical protein
VPQPRRQSRGEGECFPVHDFPRHSVRRPTAPSSERMALSLCKVLWHHGPLPSWACQCRACRFIGPAPAFLVLPFPSLLDNIVDWSSCFTTSLSREKSYHPLRLQFDLICNSLPAQATTGRKRHNEPQNLPPFPFPASVAWPLLRLRLFDSPPPALQTPSYNVQAGDPFSFATQSTILLSETLIRLPIIPRRPKSNLPLSQSPLSRLLLLFYASHLA